jgi:hypothetical protein
MSVAFLYISKGGEYTTLFLLKVVVSKKHIKTNGGETMSVYNFILKKSCKNGFSVYNFIRR